MFFVVGKKIYSNDFNKAKKVYPEVKLKTNEEGVVFLELQSSGTSELPEAHVFYNAREIIAQYGGRAAPYMEPDTLPPTKARATSK